MSKNRAAQNNIEQALYRPDVELTTKQPIDNKRFYSVPSSSTTDAMMKVFNYGDNLQGLPGAVKKTSHKTSITVKEDKQKRLIISENETAKTIIELADVEKVIGTNKAAKKFLGLALIKINEQCWSYEDGGLYSDTFTFPLQELIDIGFYTNIRAARQGFKDACQGTLTSLKIHSQVAGRKKGEDGISTGDGATAVLFTTAGIKRGQCAISINNKIDWRPLLQYYMPLPVWGFRLSNRGYDLLYTIFYLARQNTDQIKQKGYFTISMRAIQERLALPNEADTREPNKLIRQPIETAIEDIEEHLKGELTAAGLPQMTITPIGFSDAANIKEFLDNGKLKIELKEDYAEDFIAIAEKKNKKIVANIKRQQTIADNARTKALAETIKNQEKPTA